MLKPRFLLSASGLFVLGLALATRGLRASNDGIGSTAFAAEPPTSRVSDSIIRIGIVRQAGQLTLHPEGKFSAVDQQTGDTYELEPSKDYLVLAEGAKSLSLGEYHFEGQFRLIPADIESAMEVGQKRYRGSLVVKSKTSNSFTIINELGIEDYLYGVVPAEMSEGWPLEALKAQAVVARTFALGNLGKFHTEGFDLSDDIWSQGYVELSKQNAGATRAVQETQGQVLTWKGKLLKAYFHSCCGGHTCNLGVIWGTMGDAPKPLRGISDRYCHDSPKYEWSTYFPSETIVTALQKHGFPSSKVRAVHMAQRDSASGFVKTFKVKTDHGWIELRANDFRNWLGNRDFRSTKVYRIISEKDGFRFLGRGYGHGVGLCQWGAKAMAEKGKNYKQILHYYFPGAELEVHDD